MASGSTASSRAWRGRLSVPPPDTVPGVVLAVGFGLALVYVLVLVAEYPAMEHAAFAIGALSLLLSAVAAFSLAAMLGTDIATYQRLELELARTVLAYVGSGAPPASDTPLAGVWRAHVAAAEESRRVSRAHGYALGLFVGAGVASLAVTLLAGLGTMTATADLRGLAMVVEAVAFTMLVVGAGSLLVTVGYSSPVPGYELVASRRWRRNAGRQQAVDGAIGEIAWLAEFARGARETKLSPFGPSIVPSWRE